MASKYNPYNDYEKIVGYKANWHTAKNSGQDPSQYSQAALPYYQSLINNGYSDLANDLANSDHAQAGTLRAKYGLKADAQYNLDNDFAAMTGSTQTQAATPNAGNKSVYSGLDYTANDSSINKLLDQVTNGSDMMNNTYQTAQGIATGAIQTQPSAATQNLLDAYNNDYNRLNGQIQYDANGNVVSGLNTEHYNIGRNQLDYLNNFDITKQPYYQGIMDQYKLGGYNAAQGEYANGAANNGGNIDSYAAANANRQQLAFTTAGMQQAMAMANQNQQNWQNLYSQMSTDLDNQGQLSLKTLENARMMYATDADERMAALDTAGSMAKADLEAKIRAYEQAVEERMQDKQITSDEAMQEADLAEQRARLEMEIARDIYESDNLLAGTLDTNAKNLEGTKYKADADVTSTGIRANADLGVAGINANADMYSADRRAAADEYSALLGYNSDVYRADRGLDEVYAKSSADRQQAEYENQIKREYAQWLIDNGFSPTGAELKNSGDNSGTPSATIEDAIGDIEEMVNNADVNMMKQTGFANVTDYNTLKQWVRGHYDLSDADAQKVANSVAGDKGYANLYEDIATIIKDAGSANPKYNYSRSGGVPVIQ